MGQVLKALGMSSLVLKMTFLQVIALVLIVSIGVVCNGIIGVAYAMVGYGIIFRFVYQAIVNKKISMRMIEYLRSIYTPIWVNIVLGSILYIQKNVLWNFIDNQFMILLILVILGICQYIMILFLVNRGLLIQVSKFIFKR